MTCVVLPRVSTSCVACTPAPSLTQGKTVQGEHHGRISAVRVCGLLPPVQEGVQQCGALPPLRCSRHAGKPLSSPLSPCRPLPLQLEVQNKDWDRLKQGDLTLKASQIAMVAPAGDTVSVDIVSWVTYGVVMQACSVP
jgi:hypothetical protein